MANIQFVPVCSKCGERIFDPIYYGEIPEHLLPKECIYKQYQISPQYCVSCGAPFEQIIFDSQNIIKIHL